MSRPESAIYEEAMSARTPQEREQLILEHLPRVNWIAARIRDKLPSSIELDDLISAGVIGLLAAVDNFDPTHNASLGTYAEYKIRGAILDSIRGLDGIPAHKRKRVKEVQQAIARAEQKLKHTPAEDEIAAELGMGLEEYQQSIIELQGVSLDSLDAIEDGEQVSMLRFLAKDGADSPASILERAELQRVIAEGIDKLPSNERTVLSLYYKEELNLREIASVMNLHITRIAQLRAQGILRLRNSLDHKWPSKKGIY